MPRPRLPVTLVLIRDTFHEAIVRWIFWGTFALCTALILFFLFLLRIDVVEGAKATISLFGQKESKAMEVAKLVRQIHSAVAAFLYMMGMFLAVFASATLMPAALERGRVELLLSKPLRRWHILLARYSANLLLVMLNIGYLILGVWLVFGWKTGVWHASFLYAIPSTTFMFAVLLTVVTLAAVFSESAALATMITFAMMVMSPILAQHQLMAKLLSSEWMRQVWRFSYHVLPKFFDVGRINMDLVMGRAVSSWLPVWTSTAFGLVVLSAALIWFQKRDY
jgi:ABC-type transport system involved in multi-copper enzyme maturation permease subunit